MNIRISHRFYIRFMFLVLRLETIKSHCRMCETASLGHCLAPKLITSSACRIPYSVAVEAYRIAVSLIQLYITPTRVLCSGFRPSMPPAAQSSPKVRQLLRQLAAETIYFCIVHRREREDNTFTGNNFVRRVFIIYFHYVNRRSFACRTSRSMHNEMLIFVYLSRYSRLTDLLFRC